LQLKAYLGEGNQFYLSLQETLQKFKSKCNDFVFARKTEKQDLIVAIQTKPQQQVQQSQIGVTPLSLSGNTAGVFPTQMGRGTAQQQQPVVFVTQGGQMGRGPILVQPQVLQPQQIRQATNQQPFPFYVQQQPQQQYQMQPVQMQPQQPYQQQQQAQGPPPAYTQSQAQRSVFPQDPYGNLGPTGY